MKLPTVFLSLLLVLPATNGWADGVEAVKPLVSDGHWKEAQRKIDEALAQPGLSFQAREDLLFQQDRMTRMRLDFNKTREKVFQEARAIVPSLTEKMFADWEQAGAVEFLEVDGTRWYFDQAAANLFRINPEAKAFKTREHPGAGLLSYYPADVRNILTNYDRTGERFSSPKTFRVTYALNVKSGAVPAGETIRAWLPLPQTGNRQKNVRLISTDPPQFILAKTNSALSSIYLEKSAASNQPTQFKLVYEYTSDAFYQPIDLSRVLPADTNDPALTPYLAEQPTQIVFSDEIKQLSRQIVGSETNPYLKARRIFEWVGEHIPWVVAREYSTIDCLPHYALGCHHGDCGIETLTFMTLCRFNGIPARWESGLITGPDKNLHDWCEIYLPPYGWVPADVTYRFVHSDQEREKWFFLGGIDACRLVVNTDYAQPLYPAKTFFRSEIVDFQRGEVEWRGGNLYFNQWTWNFNAEEISSAPKPVP
jgi:transglutaminase-like putative cysteine protease